MHFDYMPYVRELLKDETLVNRVNGAIWRSGCWADLDRGEPVDKIYLKMLGIEPGLENEIRRTFDNVGQCMHRAEYAILWIQELKEEGFKVYYLSNYSEYLMQASPDVLDFLPLMDGGVFSCYVHLLKPERAIYQKICDEYGLDPKECVFIDDREENVLAAEAFGMKGIFFTGYPEAKKELDELIHSEKNEELYYSQRHLLETFLEHGAISKDQYEKSLLDLTVKMGMAHTEDNTDGII